MQTNPKKIVQLISAAACVASLAACGGAAPEPAHPKPPAADSDQAAATPQDEPEEPEPIASLPPIPIGVPAAPGTCTPYMDRGSSGEGCAKDKALPQLQAALSERAADARDTKLAALERCEAFPPGLITALRIDLGPAACGDQIAAPVLAKRKLSPEVESTLKGLALGARLSRLVRKPPELAAPYDKAKFNGFLKAQFAPWMRAQAKAIHDTAAESAKLTGYGKAVAALEAGLADMRLVDVLRSFDLPSDLNDPAAKDAYFGTLEQLLEPRKRRGRDAALVGLLGFAEIGILKDVRVNKARALLSKVFGGSRINALDGLLLAPAVDGLGVASTQQQLAGELPTYYAQALLTQLDVTEPVTLSVLIGNGLPTFARTRLKGEATLSDETRLYFAEALFRLGQRYWRQADFSDAKSALSTSDSSHSARLLLALASTLTKGPGSAPKAMNQGLKSLTDVSALDALAKKKSPVQGLAAYNAALLLHLATPKDAKSSYFNKLAARFKKAERLLADPAHKRLAKQQAAAALATAKAVR